jgi:DNA-binding YbaB/EbfC family protein
MFGNMMEKLQKMQQTVEESKARLENVSVKGESASGLIEVIVSGNRKVKDVKIDESILKNAPKEEVEELLLVAINKAMEQAEKIWETEMKTAASGILPGLSGLF